MITNIPTPYIVDFAEAISAHPGLELKVLYLSEGESHRDWKTHFGEGYEYAIMRGVNPGKGLYINPGIIGEILRWKADFCLVHGTYTAPTFMLAAMVLNIAGRKWGFWGEPIKPTRINPILRLLRRNLSFPLIKSSSVLVAIGQNAIETYKKIGVAEEKLYLLPYSRDTSIFKIDPDKRMRIRNETRKRLGFNDEMIFLTSAQLIGRKGVDLLIRAYSRLSSRKRAPALLIMGSGSEEESLKKLAVDLKAPGIQFLGFVQPREIPRIFFAADVFVLASLHDGWGVVLNEAAAAGLPIIATNMVGAARHIVKQDKNGFIVEANNIDSLSEIMDRFISGRIPLDKFGQKSIKIVQDWTPNKMAQRLYRIVEEVSIG